MMVLDTVGKVIDRFDLLCPDNGLTEAEIELIKKYLGVV